MEILVTNEPVAEEKLREMADEWHGTLVKGAADIERGILALGGEWHMDANVKLIEEGSSQEHLWGFNIYPDERGAAALEYISLINIRPAQGNRNMELQDEALRSKIRAIAARIFPYLNL